MLTPMPMVMAPGFLATEAAGLARELAQDIRLPSDILKDYGFTGPHDPRFVALSESKDFQRLLEEALREWNNADSTKKRIRLKAQTALEENLPRIFETAQTAGDPKDRNDAAKLLAKLGGFEEQQLAGANGEAGGVRIVINIGQKRIEKDSGPKVISPDGVPVAEAIREAGAES